MLGTSPQAMFRRTLPERIAASDTVRLLTWSNAIELETDAGAKAVRAVNVACLGGNHYRVVARMVILAQGGFEVPRLLLASNRVASAGLGNGHDLVGRFLMDRQIVKAGTLVPAKPGGLGRFAFYDMRRTRGVDMIGKLVLSQETLAREEILSSLISFSPANQSLLQRLARRPFGRGTTFRSPAYASARALLAAARHGRLPPHPLRHLARIAGGLDDLLYAKLLRGAMFQGEFNLDIGGWSSLPDFERRFSALEVHQMCEQSPDPDNRITLSDSRDATGMPSTHVQFRWRELDIRSVTRAQEILEEDIAQAGLGEFHLERRGELPLLAQMSAHHPSGTTRMAGDPTQGVVDADCRVHGVGNLFIASSSVFPTSGYAPPTLTIIALAIRICDMVKSLLTPASADLEEVTH
jgi:choline dehydrogenase-like flavoprotein